MLPVSETAENCFKITDEIDFHTTRVHLVCFLMTAKWNGQTIEQT